MTHFGPEAHFRLRGDTIGYIVELLQGYMVDRLESAILLAIHRQISNHSLWAIKGRVVQVQGDDIALAFRRTKPCYSSSGIVWRWPLDNCHDALPAEAGWRIIRRLAYIAGIPEMSNDAFILAEAELLHALGELLVSAYDSCDEKTNTVQLLDAEEQLTYNEPNVEISMFKSPPPPFYPKPSTDWQYQDHPNDAVVYTIVPGQIETAAEQRDITPRKVYGDVWVAISGFDPEEEKKTEKSYYYKETFHGDESEESESENEEDEDSSIDYEMDMHQYYDSREDMHLYYDSDMELDLHYDSANDEMYSHEPYRVESDL